MAFHHYFLILLFNGEIIQTLWNSDLCLSISIYTHSEMSGACSCFSTTSSLVYDFFKMQMLLTINKIIAVTNNIEYLTMSKCIAR